MHIAFWSPAWPLEKFQNGIITYVHWMKRALELQGHRVSVLTDTLDHSTNDHDVYRVQQVRRRLWSRAVRRIIGRQNPSEHGVFDFSETIAAAILRVHQQDPIDVIEMEESFGWFEGVRKLTTLPLVVKLHGPAFLTMVAEELHSSFGREKVDREGCALRLATAIVSPSERTLIQTIEQYRLTPKYTAHIVNPVTMDGITPLWCLDACDRNTILFVGRFDLLKGADVVLNAFLSVLEDRPHLKLVFVGPDRGLPGADGKQVQFEAYCDMLFQPKIRNRVDFRGPMANREIALLRIQAMMTVIASRWESQGYTVLEAMLQGCPVVSTDAGACPESVIHGVTGRLAKSEDPNDFAAQMRAMLDDPKSAEAMGQEARQYVIGRHSATRVAALSLEMYARVIADHRS
jgi:glycosyltransferase involved in cell wall biosynthesis